MASIGNELRTQEERQLELENLLYPITGDLFNTTFDTASNTSFNTPLHSEFPYGTTSESYGLGSTSLPTPDPALILSSHNETTWTEDLALHGGQWPAAQNGPSYLPPHDDHFSLEGFCLGDLPPADVQHDLGTQAASPSANLAMVPTSVLPPDAFATTTPNIQQIPSLPAPQVLSDIPNGLSDGKGSRSQSKGVDWKRFRPAITQVYMDLNQTLEATMITMEGVYGLTAT